MDFSLLFCHSGGIGSTHIYLIWLYILQHTSLYTYFFLQKNILPINTLFFLLTKGRRRIWCLFVLYINFFPFAAFILIEIACGIRKRKSFDCPIMDFDWNFSFFLFIYYGKRKLFREVNLLVIFEISFHKFLWCLSLITEIRGNGLLEKNVLFKAFISCVVIFIKIN